jgi:hypothetical protein
VGGRGVVDSARAAVQAINPDDPHSAPSHATLLAMQDAMSKQGMGVHPAVQAATQTPLQQAPVVTAPVAPVAPVAPPLITPNSTQQLNSTSAGGNQNMFGPGTGPTNADVEAYANQQTQAGNPVNWDDARTILNHGVSAIAPVAPVGSPSFVGNQAA